MSTVKVLGVDVSPDRINIPAIAFDEFNNRPRRRQISIPPVHQYVNATYSDTPKGVK